MSITSSNVSSLYITMFNRAPEGAGHKFWLDTANANKLDITQLSQMMLDSKPAKEYFAGKEANADFVNHIYKNLFNKTSAEDAEGVKFWVDKLNTGNSKAFIVTEMLKAAANNTYTKPEDIKAQNLFKNKVKAAEAVSKVIADVPESGTILEKISGFNAILKNIKDTSTPTQIAQVIKQEALKGKLKISDDKTIADSLKAIFPSSDSAAIEKALNSTTVDTNIYPSVPTPPTPTPPGGSGGNSGGGSGGSSGGSPSPKPTPDEIKQQELDKKAKEAEENLKTKDEALKLAKLEKDITAIVKTVITKPANGNNKEKMLEDINQQIAGAVESEKVKLEAAKKEIEKLPDTITLLERDMAINKANVAEKKANLAEEEKKVAKDEKDIANFLAKEKALDAAIKNAKEALDRADFDKAVENVIKDSKGDVGEKTIEEVIEEAKNHLAMDTPEKKASVEAKIKALAALQNLQPTDKTTQQFIDKAAENLDKANKVYAQTSEAKNKAEQAKNDAKHAKQEAERKIQDDKIAIIKANVDLKAAELEAADQILAHDQTNPDLKKVAEDARAAFEEAKNKEGVEITKLLADKFKAVILEKDGDTNVYKSADSKYIVDITGGTVNDGKTLVVGEDNKLYEIDKESDDLEPNATLDNKVVLVKESDTKATTFKNGAEEINFILKDGKLQAAFKDTKGFIPSGNTEASYANLSKAAIADNSFSINDTEQQGHSIVLADSKVKKIKIAAGEYALADAEKTELASIESITEKAVGDVKFPLINGKVVNGTIGANTIFANDQNKLDAIKIDTKKYYFNSNDQVIKVKVGEADSDPVYTLKNPADFATIKAIPDAKLKELSNFAENNEAKFILEAGKLMKIQVKDGAELNVKIPEDFDPAQINTVEIDKVIISGKEFTLTAAAQYQFAKAYKQVEGKNLLKGAEYVNATVEESGNKYVTTEAGADKYTLKVTKADKKVYVEQLESGITKTKNFKEDGNAIKDVVFKGTEANDQDKITINSTGDEAQTINKANLDKATFDSIEELTIDLDTLLTSKEFGIISEKNIGIILGQNIKVSDIESQDAKSINLTNIKSYDHKLTLDLAQNRGVDTITLGKVLAKDKLAIVGFAADDKIDFRALGVTASTVEKAIEADANKQGFAGNKIYSIKGSPKAADQIKFDDLFDADGKPFNKTGLDALAVETKAIISIIGSDNKTGLYLVDVKGGDGLNDDADITLIGILEGEIALGNANIAIA
ncbi:DUF4214 domain-containing protein [Campylobacter sp. RM16190]|uniref:DUF4214 domain-containing protein n=1 Tax=Campylobacter sp. RM16190 TaxID=1705727 RepID=UPI0014763ABA|nr:DUF4214 domain-containing protein [Campylobacter sp. RM16190]